MMVKCAHGEMSVEPALIKYEFVNYFKRILGVPGDQIPLKKELVSEAEVVKDDHCRMLIQEATDREVWLASQNIGSKKAPGPEGFSAKIFKSNWNIWEVT